MPPATAVAGAVVPDDVVMAVTLRRDERRDTHLHG
jgi:hypothetical protein